MFVSIEFLPSNRRHSAGPHICFSVVYTFFWFLILLVLEILKPAIYEYYVVSVENWNMSVVSGAALENMILI